MPGGVQVLYENFWKGLWKKHPSGQTRYQKDLSPPYVSRVFWIFFAEGQAQRKTWHNRTYSRYFEDRDYHPKEILRHPKQLGTIQVDTG